MMLSKLFQAIMGITKPTSKLNTIYEITNKGLGSGGNCVVKEVRRNSDGKYFALKRLQSDIKIDDKKCVRFRDEIEILIECKGIDGVIPIEDYSFEELWYTMPKAESIDKYTKSVNDKVECVLQISNALVDVHSKKYAHRDIKPANILYLNGKFVLADFGLVDIPDNPHGQTRDKDRIGAIRTLAPEMSRNPVDADGKKADVYSLAKTLWILLTGNNKGFEGVYDYNDPAISLGACPNLKGEHLVEIEELIHQATMHDPSIRPTMEEFSKMLQQWKEIKDNSDFIAWSNWEFLEKKIFIGNPPTTCKWEETGDIIYVLQLIKSLSTYSYLFCPERGDLDFDDAMVATEKGCIDIIANSMCLRVKPKCLEFNRFKIRSWNYFMLELDTIEPILKNSVINDYEEVVEDYPGHYVSAEYFQYGVYDYNTGNPLPPNSRKIYRLLKGKIVIVLKFGPINEITELSDGRHSRCSKVEYRDFIHNLELVDERYFDKQISNIERKNIQFQIVRLFPYGMQYSLITSKDSNETAYEEEYIKKNFAQFDFHEMIDDCKEIAQSPMAGYSFCLKNCSILSSSDILLEDNAH